MSGGGGPRLARWLVRALVPARDAEYIVGDMEELHRERALRRGSGEADKRYWKDALASIWARWRRRERGPGGGVAPPPRRPLRDFATDLARAPRGLLRQPGFVLLVTLTLAVGVGATAAVFGMVNQLVLRPLPGAAEPSGAAYLTFQTEDDPDGQGRGIALLDFDAVRAGASLLEGLASYGRTSLRVTLGDERPFAAMGQTIYGDYFEVLGVRAAEGRLLRADETRLGADPRVTVISEDLRARLFGPGAAAAGRTIRLNGEPVTIVGVAGGGFRGPERADVVDLWIPHPSLTVVMDFTEDVLTSRNSVMHRQLILRPRAGVEAAAVEAQLAGVLQRLAAIEPESAEWLSALRPRLHEGLHLPPLWRSSTYQSLRLLAGVVALVLLIACANVANLLLFRNLARRGALATRRALGASTGRLARAQIAEALWLGLFGTLGGLAVAWAIALPFRGERLMRMPAFEGFAMDGRVAAFAAALVALTTLLFGVVPAALAGRFDLDASLRDASGRDTQRGRWLRRGMSAAQVALSLTLLVGGLLLARTIRNLYAVDTGYDVEGVSAVYLEAREVVEAFGGLHAGGGRLLDAVRSVPGVRGAALDVYGPHGPRMMARAGLPGVEPRDAERATMWTVTAGWFELIGVELIAGRPLRPDDAEPGAPGRVVVTASLARRLFGDADPVGRTIEAGFHALEPLEVVGVTRELRSASSPDTPEAGFFLPFGREDVPFLTFLVRTADSDPATLARVRAAVEAVLPEQPVPDPVPLAERLAGIHGERLLFGRLLGLLSTLAVALSAVGLYGVIAFGAAGRAREFGIRMALGARDRRIAGLVLGDAARIVLLGTVGGLFGAWILGRALESRLYGVAPVDPVSWAAAALLFASVAFLACWTPARRATRVDPVHTLKGE